MEAESLAGGNSCATDRVIPRRHVDRSCRSRRPRSSLVSDNYCYSRCSRYCARHSRTFRCGCSRCCDPSPNQLRCYHPPRRPMAENLKNPSEVLTLRVAFPNPLDADIAAFDHRLPETNARPPTFNLRNRASTDFCLSTFISLSVFSYLFIYLSFFCLVFIW